MKTPTYFIYWLLHIQWSMLWGSWDHSNPSSPQRRGCQPLRLLFQREACTVLTACSKMVFHHAYSSRRSFCGCFQSDFWEPEGDVFHPNCHHKRLVSFLPLHERIHMWLMCASVDSEVSTHPPALTPVSHVALTPSLLVSLLIDYNSMPSCLFVGLQRCISVSPANTAPHTLRLMLMKVDIRRAFWEHICNGLFLFLSSSLFLGFRLVEKVTTT